MRDRGAGFQSGARVFHSGGGGRATAPSAARLVAAARFLPSAALAAALIAAALGAALGGCARKPAAAPGAPLSSYPYALSGRHVFYPTAGGLSERPDPAAAEARAARAPNASVLSSEGRTILAALNGRGLARLEIEPAGGAFRIVGTALPELFASLSTGGAWPASGGRGVGGGFLVQLYRDPFEGEREAAGRAGGSPPSGGGANEGARAGGPASARLLWLDRSGAVRALDPFAAEAGPGFELFALFPSQGRWYAELREDRPERANLAFFALEDPLAERPDIRRLGRAAFESALRPRPMTALRAPEAAALRAALAALGGEPRLARLRSAEGEDGWYLSGGAVEEARPAFAWYDGRRSWALSPEGLLAVAREGAPATLLVLEPPLAGASFTALAAAGDLVAAAWEAGDFPDISAAGILTLSIRD